MLKSTFTGLERCRWQWQYRFIFIRLAVVAKSREILLKFELIAYENATQKCRKNAKKNKLH